MRGSTLVNAVREDTAKYPNVCKMLIYLYDDEHQEHIGEDAVFVNDLFANNPESRTNFIKTLAKLEQNVPVFMNVQITESSVILFYKTPRAKLFPRNQVPDNFESED